MTLPAKSSFKFSELAVVTGVKPYVLRFWETEFEQIQAVSAEDGSKIYSRADVELFLKIKELLFEQKMSLQEAKATINQPAVSAEFDDRRLELRKIESVTLILSEALSFTENLKQKYQW